jgi:hypothetical protein
MGCLLFCVIDVRKVNDTDIGIAMVFLLGQMRRILQRAHDPLGEGGSLLSNLSVSNGFSALKND